MTISAARLNANKRNAKRSTGPVTPAGKEAVRLNARKHGLRAESDVVAPDEAEAFAARRREWAGSFPERDGRRGWLADQVVLASVRIDRCQVHRREQESFEADRASSCWDADREADAARIGARLGKEPDRVVAALRRSAAGIDWLLARWSALADLLDADGTWDDPHRALCLDLLRTPAAFRDAEGARLAALPADALRELALAEVAQLESLREPALTLDDMARQLAAMGLPTEEGADLRRLRRYEDALWHRFRALEASYEAAGTPAPVPAPGPADAPAPIAPPRAESASPAPRPDRTPRNAPPLDPSPSSPAVARNAPPQPPAPLNRRQRRAALKKAKSRR